LQVHHRPAAIPRVDRAIGLHGSGYAAPISDVNNPVEPANGSVRNRKRFVDRVTDYCNLRTGGGQLVDEFEDVAGKLVIGLHESDIGVLACYSDHLARAYIPGAAYDNADAARDDVARGHD